MRQAAANELQDLQDPDLQRIHDHPSWLVGSTGADGAVSVNADYEGGPPASGTSSSSATGASWSAPA
jgi:hypothetical protein